MISKVTSKEKSTASHFVIYFVFKDTFYAYFLIIIKLSDVHLICYGICSLEVVIAGFHSVLYCILHLEFIF